MLGKLAREGSAEIGVERERAAPWNDTDRARVRGQRHDRAERLSNLHPAGPPLAAPALPWREGPVERLSPLARHLGGYTRDRRPEAGSGDSPPRQGRE